MGFGRQVESHEQTAFHQTNPLLQPQLSIDGMLELFNAFDRANYGSYVLDESSPAFGDPDQNANLAYAPRTVQLGFRLSF